MLKRSLKMMAFICSHNPKLAPFVSRLLIMVGKDNESKIKRLQMEAENSQSFVVEILKSALFANQVVSEIIDQVALKLMAIDHIDDAMDVLLISKNWQKAITSFIGTRESYRAQLIARLNVSKCKPAFAIKTGRRMLNDGDPGGCLYLAEKGLLLDLVKMLPRSARLSSILLSIYAEMHAVKTAEEEEEEDVVDDNYSL